MAVPALTGLFAAWMMLPPRSAAIVGYAAGLVFFGTDFAWFGETAGALLGPFGALVDLGPALVEAVAFALAGALTSTAAFEVGQPWAAVAAASAFTIAELLRSIGPLGVPLYQIGAAFVETPLAPCAAFGGVYAMTFAIALVAAAAAAAAVFPGRMTVAGLGATVGFVGVAALAAGAAWPARAVPAGTLRVAVVQGNIRQSVKWEPRSLPLAVERYRDLTERVRALRPAFVLWPETVITTDLRIDPALAALPANAELVATARTLQAAFGDLARSLGTTLAVGSNDAAVDATYNGLFFFSPRGTLETTYRKRRLVPFAEFLPGPGWLRALPFASLVSDFGAGTAGGPIDPELRIAPLICWEAGFGELAHGEVMRGARFFAVATDDAWFGDSDGPYAQAQLAQLRALETGRWVVRAAATGISGIIAPDGTWRERSTLDTQAVIGGTIAAPQPTAYSRLGPNPIGAAIAFVGLVAFVLGGGMRRRRVR